MSRITHGLSKIPEYAVHRNMLNRCYNPDNKCYPLYGGAGVRVCDRWRASLQDFLDDMGPRPSPDHSIDRIDPFGNYELDNCRWADRKTQARNKRIHAVRRAALKILLYLVFLRLMYSAVTSGQVAKAA